MIWTAQQVARLIRSGRYRLGHEALLQVDVEDLLRSNRVPYAREHVLGPGERVDFLVAGYIAVELKIKAQRRLIYRQMQRYALHDRVTSLILVTAAAIGMPPAIEGKPVFVVSLGHTAL